MVCANKIVNSDGKKEAEEKGSLCNTGKEERSLKVSTKSIHKLIVSAPEQIKVDPNKRLQRSLILWYQKKDKKREY